MYKIFGAITFIALLVSGCSVNVPYKKLGDSPGWASGVGFSEFEIGKNKYKVSYTGGVYDSADKVMKFTYKRAKELCLEKGFKEYDITNTGMGSKAAGGMSQSYGNTQFNDNKSQTIYSLDVKCK